MADVAEWNSCDINTNRKSRDQFDTTDVPTAPTPPSALPHLEEIWSRHPSHKKIDKGKH